MSTMAMARSRLDRKSTRLNSSHGYISYAVFCLKKKKLERARIALVEAEPQTHHLLLPVVARRRQLLDLLSEHPRGDGGERAGHAGLGHSVAPHTVQSPMTLSPNSSHVSTSAPTTRSLELARPWARTLPSPPWHTKRCLLSAHNFSTSPTSLFFFFNNPAPPEISPFPLPDALPI